MKADHTSEKIRGTPWVHHSLTLRGFGASKKERRNEEIISVNIYQQSTLQASHQSVTTGNICKHAQHIQTNCFREGDLGHTDKISTSLLPNTPRK
jgi:hypothetical protein